MALWIAMETTISKRKRTKTTRTRMTRDKGDKGDEDDKEEGREQLQALAAFSYGTGSKCKSKRESCGSGCLWPGFF
jgi:hypothetical protein